MTHTDFGLAAATLTGRDHRNINVPKNGQDGLALIRSATCTIAVITDGCGSSPHSEVGAKLGARLTAESVHRQISERGLVDWQQVLTDLLSPISQLAVQMGGSYRQAVQDYFLFTLLGVLIDTEMAQFFALGDGVVAINGVVQRLGPFAGNQPPYAAYRLLGQPLYPGRDESRLGLGGIDLVDSVPLARLEHFLIGSDGVFDLIAAEQSNLPGLTEPVGPLSQFWDGRFFDPAKPDLLARRLRIIGRDWPRKEPEPGLLPDDTTIISGCRLPTTI